MKGYIVLLLVSFGIVTVLFLGWRYYLWQVQTPKVQESSLVSFSIEEGETPDTIAETLEEQGIIRSKIFFQLYLSLHPDLATGIQAGDYEVSSQFSIIELIDIFQNGTTLKRITFIEGWRREEMARYLETAFDKQFALSFLELTQEKEGYLFPDTYIVGTTITPDELVALMVTTYQNKVSDSLQNNLGNSGLTQEQLTIFASIVEREIADSNDRRIVAGILRKRWENGWLIGADATVQYVWSSSTCAPLDTTCIWWPTNISNEMLSVESPYNTRKYVGLPPGPIANPGLDAIRAVLNAEVTSYWYYLTDAQGITHYAETFEQHNANIARYL